MRHSTLIALIAGLLTCALFHVESAQAGDVYKYVDERGNTLYTDKPIPGAIKVSSGAQRPPEVSERNYAAQQSAANQQLSSSNQRIAQSQSDSRVAATVAKDLEATRKDRCKQARDAYNTAINSRRLYTEDKEGKRVYMSDAELSQQRLDTAKAVESICGPQG